MAADGTLPNTRVVLQRRRLGYAGTVKRMLRHVTTPYVLVCQHDFSFLRPVSLHHVLAGMAAAPHDVRYVGLPSGGAVYPCTLAGRGRFGDDVAAAVGAVPSGHEFAAAVVAHYSRTLAMPVCPLNFW
jgi:hypothetical protein